MLELKRVFKSFAGISVIRGIDHVFPEAGTICISGANGSGKSTLLAMMAGVEPVSAGSILVRQENVCTSQAKKHLSYVPDDCPVYPFLNGAEWLGFAAAARGQRAPGWDGLIAAFGLAPHLGTAFGDMSLGTARKFLLATALSTDPALLLMDEPSNGLDADAMAALQRMLHARRAQGKLTLFASHSLEFAEAVGADILPIAQFPCHAG